MSLTLYVIFPGPVPRLPLSVCGPKLLNIYVPSYCFSCACACHGICMKVRSNSWGSSGHRSWRQAPLPAEPSCQPKLLLKSSSLAGGLSGRLLPALLICPLLAVLVVSGSDFWWERYQASQEALILPCDNFSGSKNPGEPQAVQSPKLPSCSSIPESQCSGALHPLPSSSLFRI